MGFNDRATAVSRGARTSKFEVAPYVPTQTTIDRRAQTIRQKKLKVSLATVRLVEEGK